MTAVYPGALASIAANKQDDTDAGDGSDGGVSTTVGDHAGHHNQLAEELVAVQTELGTNAKGPYATNIRNRFEILDWKRSCRLSPVGNVAGTYANGTAGVGATKTVGGTSWTVDGVAAVNGDRVFLKEQTAPLENGIYEVSGVGTSVVLTRTYDSDTPTKMSDNMYVSVEQGSANRDTTWEMTTDNPVTIGTTALRFSRVAPAYTMPISLPSAATPMQFSNSILENMPRHQTSIIAHATTALASGTIRVFPMGLLRAGDTATGINMISGTAGATFTGVWAGIARLSDRVVLARSNNSTTVFTANVVRNFPFSAAFTADKDEAIVGFFMAAATTLPTMFGVTGPVNAVMMGNPVINGTSNTGQGATPLAVGAAMTAYTADTEILYAYLN